MPRGLHVFSSGDPEYFFFSDGYNQRSSSFIAKVLILGPMSFSLSFCATNFSPFVVTDTFKTTYVLLCDTLIQFGNVAGFYLFTQAFILLQSLFSFSVTSKGWKL